MDIIMGLIAAVFWGATDFLVGINARAVGVKRAVFFGQSVGALVMSAIVLLFYGQLGRLLSASWDVLLLGVVASLCTVVGALALSKAFALGKTAIVAPLITSYGVFTALLAWIAGETISPSQFVGIFICVTGVVLASTHNEGFFQKNSSHGALAIGYALVAAILYGTSFWVQGKFSLPVIGPISMLWLSYVVGVIFLFPAVYKEVFSGAVPPSRAIIASLCGASLLNLGGFSAFSFGVFNGSISIVTVISTLSGGVAGVFGCVFCREKLTWLQVSGVVLVLLGAVVLHFYS